MISLIARTIYYCIIPGCCRERMDSTDEVSDVANERFAAKGVSEVRTNQHNYEKMPEGNETKRYSFFSFFSWMFPKKGASDTVIETELQSRSIDPSNRTYSSDQRAIGAQRV